MKLTIGQLKNIITESVIEGIDDRLGKDEDPVAELQSFIARLQDALATDTWRNKFPDAERDVNRALSAIRKLRARETQRNRTPESKAAAAEKAIITRAKNAAEAEADLMGFMSRRAAEEAAIRSRMASGLLPLFVIGDNGDPSSKYYKQIGDFVAGPDGYRLPKFMLKPAYLKTKVKNMQAILNGSRPVPS
jgi:hypothetical protein